MADPIVILLVEDEAAHVEAIRRAFEAADAETEIQVAGSLREYRAAVAARPPDLALLDLNLPDGRAMEVLTFPPAASPFPILIMTSYGNERIAVEAMKSGALDYIVKSPGAFADTPRTVERALREWGLLRERQRAEEQIARLALFVNTANDAIIGGDNEGRVTYWNETAHRLYGWSAAEAVGRLIEELLPMGIAELTRFQVREQVRQHGSWRGEVVQQDRLGRRLDVELSVSLIRDATGQVVGSFGVNRDITERKRAEEALKTREQQFRALIQNSKDAIALLDNQGTILFFPHSATARILGYDDRELIGRSVFALIHAEDRPKASDLLAHLLKEPGGQVTAQFRFQHKDGSWRWLESTGTNLLGEPSVQSVVINYSDITGRKQAEEALRESEERYRALFEGAAEGVYQSTPAGRLTLANPALARMMGYASPQELIAGVTDIGRQLNVDPGLRAEFQRRIAERGEVQGFEFQARRKDGAAIWISENAHALRDASGAVLYYEGTLQDITERKRAEEALREMNEHLEIRVQERTTELAQVNRTLQAEIAERKRAQEALQKAHRELEQRVAERTDELRRANEELRTEITQRKQAEKRVGMLSQEIIAAREEERKQVSSVLHHDVGSLAVGISAHLDAIEQEVVSGKPGEALQWMKRTRKLFGESVVRLKGLAVELRPPDLDVLGLGAALQQYFSAAPKRGGVRVHFKESLGRRRVPGGAATILFRVAQEALTNAITHGRAKQVDVDVRALKGEITLTVHDNGKEFDPSEQMTRVTSQMGLRVMREMALSAGGVFTVDSGRGKGTTVRVRLPLSR